MWQCGYVKIHTANSIIASAARDDYISHIYSYHIINIIQYIQFVLKREHASNLKVRRIVNYCSTLLRQ